VTQQYSSGKIIWLLCCNLVAKKMFDMIFVDVLESEKWNKKRH